MSLTPEAEARQNIDALLTAAGWAVQDSDAYDPRAGRGIALREMSLKTGFADYLMIVDRQAVGVVEAKAAGATLAGVDLLAAPEQFGEIAEELGSIPRTKW
jgi:type I restriction enzyme R subunit